MSVPSGSSFIPSRMKIRRLLVFGLLVLGCVAANDVAPSKAELEGMYDKAFRAFDSGKFDEALQQLDAIDARKPDLAESQNLRGVIYMRQSVYDKAEAALSEAQRLDPKFWNAHFNLAEIPFMKKEWPEARKRFEELLTSNAKELEGEAAQLIRYKILLTYLMEGNDPTVDSLLAKFEVASDTPALQYAKTAIALQHQNMEEAKKWIATAEKDFSPQLNKLFAESLFEIGWLQRQPGQQRAALQLLSPEQRAAKTETAVRSKFEEAELAYEQRDFAKASSLAEEADTAEPNKAATLNLRGEIALEQQKYSEAEGFFNRALKADKNFREAQFNLADLPFRQKEYGKARTRFEALAKTTAAGDRNQASQLIRFKVFMTHLLEGKDSRAQKAMEQFQFSGDTPALYYAQAAWEFQHGNPEKANDWIASARKIYPLSANTVYGASFYDLGWLKGSAAVTSPSPGVAASAASLAQNESAGPAIEPSPIPGLDQKSEEPSLSLAQGTPVPGMEAMNSAPQMAVISPTPTSSSASETAVEQTPAPASANETAPTVVVAQASPTPTIVAKVEEAQAASPAPASSAASTPATVLAPAQVQAEGSSSLGDRLDHLTGPRPLLFVLLGGGGVALLAWMAISRFRGGSGVAVAGGPNLPIGGNGPRLEGGPRRMSVQLKPSEPSLRRGSVPLSKRVAEVPAVLEPAASANGHEAPPNEKFDDSSVGEVVEQASAPAVESKAPPFEVPPVGAEAAIVAASTATWGEKVAEENSVPAHNAEWTDQGSAAMPPDVPVQPAPMEPEFHGLEQQPSSHGTEEVSRLAEPETFIASETASILRNDAEPSPAWTSPEQVVETVSEPVFQGQPVPYQTVTSSAEDLAQPVAPPPLDVAPVPAAEPAMEHSPADEPRPVQGAEFPPEEVVAQTDAPPEDLHPQPITTESMPDTQTPAAPVIRTPNQPNATSSAPMMGGASQPHSGGMQTAVQITFSCEIASMQLTPTFKMGALQLRPVSKVVTMRLAPSQQQQGSPMNLQVNFEVARVQPGSGTLGQMRLNPSQQQKPPTLGTPSFSISGLQLVSAQETAPVQLTPQQQGQASVHVTAAFQITTVEFSQSFDISSIILNSTGRTVLVQLPGAGEGALENAPAFEIANVQLGPNGEIALLQLSPLAARRVV